MTTTTHFIGESPPRVEDRRILAGAGHFVDDIELPGMLHAAILRSPISHGRIVNVDADRARSLPGVVAVLTGAEINAACATIQLPERFTDHLRPVFGPMADGRVRYVGDPIAIVVAESRYLAEDARDAIDVDIEPLEPVASIAQALDPARPPLFEDGNIVFHERKAYGEPDAAMAVADHIVSERFSLARVCPSPMETRGRIASHDAATDELTLYVNTQSPHTHKITVGMAMGRDPATIRVIAPDIGGAFGQKSALMAREDAALCAAAIQVGRPLKNIEDRAENLTVASMGREEDLEVALAFNDDGSLVALDVHMFMDQGAYSLQLIPSALFAWVVRVMMPGPYRIEHLRWELTVVNTTKATYSAYRGPWAVEALVREVLIDRAARELGLDPVEIRRRNLLRMDEQPRKMITGPTLAAVTALESVERAGERADLVGFRAQQSRARAEGRLLGVGFATFTEAAPGPLDYGEAIGNGVIPPEQVRVRLERNGHLTLFTSQATNGQGHETTFAQVAATEFGLPLEHVHVVHGDTAQVPFGVGTSGSRAGTMASGAAQASTRAVREKTLDAAADTLEISPADLEIVDGMVRPRGVPTRTLSLAEIAVRSHDEAESEETAGFASIVPFFQPDGGGGWSGGTHVCFVEVDPETGVVEILRYLMVEDCGQVINPAIVDGQLRGGVAQGIGIALYESALYDEDGNFLTATFMDYLLPTSMEIPPIEIEHMESVPLHSVDFRGVGEGGTVCAPPAVANAVADALGGAAITSLPLTPERVLELVRAMR
jgi:carbon-monoxide dehydrogenase large subunit